MLKQIDTVLASDLQPGDLFEHAGSTILVTEVDDGEEFVIKGLDEFDDYIEAFPDPLSRIDLFNEVDDDEG